jgi:L-lactate dehydrogenase complex protein LldG
VSARDNILGRIRQALGRDAPLSEARSVGLRARLAEHARGPLPRMNWDLTDRFRERALELSSTIDEIERLADLPTAVARYARENGLPTAAVCWPEFANLDWKGNGLEVEARAANGEDKVGITGVYCAVAETGTLMLLSGPDTPLNASLLPDSHIAVVPVRRIVRCMEESFDLLRGEHGELPRQVAFVSGPSRTADIEMTLVLGIHGPYRVHIVLVNG